MASLCNYYHWQMCLKKSEGFFVAQMKINAMIIDGCIERFKCIFQDLSSMPPFYHVWNMNYVIQTSCLSIGAFPASGRVKSDKFRGR